MVPARENAAVTRAVVRYLCFHSARTASERVAASIHSTDTHGTFEICVSGGMFEHREERNGDRD